jgi:hypothetical protein
MCVCTRACVLCVCVCRSLQNICSSIYVVEIVELFLFLIPTASDSTSFPYKCEVKNGWSCTSPPSVRLLRRVVTTIPVRVSTHVVGL